MKELMVSFFNNAADFLGLYHFFIAMLCCDLGKEFNIPFRPCNR